MTLSVCQGWVIVMDDGTALNLLAVFFFLENEVIISLNPCVFRKLFLCSILRVITKREREKRQSRTTWWHKILSAHAVYDSYERFILLFIKSTPTIDSTQLSGEIWNYGLSLCECMCACALDENHIRKHSHVMSRLRLLWQQVKVAFAPQTIVWTYPRELSAFQHYYLTFGSS